MSQVKNPPLRYYGAKYRLAPWIIGLLPDHTTYVEPCGGGAGVLLRKPQSPIEVYNDIDKSIVNFFRVLRDSPDELIAQVKLTPFSREELRLSYEPIDNPIEAARRLFVRSWQSHASLRGDKKSGWRHQKGIFKGKRDGLINDFNGDKRIQGLFDCADRISKVSIECADVLETIERYDSEQTAFYLDPPYMGETRSKNWRYNGYNYEMNDEDHKSLARHLNKVKGSVLISGYPTEAYDKWYRGWEKFTKKSQDMTGNPRTEVIWRKVNSAQPMTGQNPQGTGARPGDQV